MRGRECPHSDEERDPATVIGMVRLAAMFISALRVAPARFYRHRSLLTALRSGGDLGRGHFTMADRQNPANDHAQTQDWQILSVGVRENVRFNVLDATGR